METRYVAVAVIYDAKGKILIVRRAPNKIPFPNVSSLPSTYLRDTSGKFLRSPVPEEEAKRQLADAIEKKLKQINNEGEKKHSLFQHGDKITIKDGPFRDYEAIFDTQISGKERVKVLLKLLGDRRQIPIELSINQITKK